MKARFTIDGTLVVELETPIECYAYRCWFDSNVKPARDKGLPVNIDIQYVGPIKDSEG